MILLYRKRKKCSIVNRNAVIHSLRLFRKRKQPSYFQTMFFRCPRLRGKVVKERSTGRRSFLSFVIVPFLTARRPVKSLCSLNQRLRRYPSVYILVFTVIQIIVGYRTVFFLITVICAVDKRKTHSRRSYIAGLAVSNSRYACIMQIATFTTTNCCVASVRRSSGGRIDADFPRA